MAQLVLLIMAAMLLIHVAELKFSEKSLIDSKVQAGRMAMAALEQNLGLLTGHGKGELREAGRDPLLFNRLHALLAAGGFSDPALVDSRGDLCWEGTGTTDRQVLGLAREALQGGGSTILSGSTWGVIGLGPKDLLISAPLYAEGRLLGAAAFKAPLAPIYASLRKAQKVIIAYILLDTLILTLVGIVLLSRIVVKPIHKLLKIAGEYRDGRVVSLPAETSTNEIGELSRSLTGMLKRLEENKGELKAHISSLENANAQLQQAQSELIRSEKLASVGRLAAGVAHEIGNPISISMGYLELLKKGDVSEEERRDFTDRLETEIARINRIIRQLLDFSRPASGRPEEMHVHEVLLNTMNILKPQPMMQEIELLFLPKAEDDRLLADPGRLQQVFLNILMNAADALSEDGGGSGGGKKKIFVRTWNGGGDITVEFTDTGPGIPSGELTHVFDPFYTTKEPGKGTGLGLSVCYRIVENMGGAIRAECREGEGATFLVTLPLQKPRGDVSQSSLHGGA
jgi:two-component system, NtrC family, sensor kinase